MSPEATVTKQKKNIYTWIDVVGGWGRVEEGAKKKPRFSSPVGNMSALARLCPQNRAIPRLTRPVSYK